jgi:methyl-accepting chemotaxis protein
MPIGEMHKLAQGINEINTVVDNADHRRVCRGARVLVAQGDLTQLGRTAYQRPLRRAQVRRINETIDRLSVTVIDHPGGGPRRGERRRREINSGADDLSQRTEEQASSLEETAATTEQLAASVKASAAVLPPARSTSPSRP